MAQYNVQPGLMPFEEIAKELGVTKQCVSQTYQKAIVKVAAMMIRRGYSDAYPFINQYDDGGYDDVTS